MARRLLWEQENAGSIPVTPTKLYVAVSVKAARDTVNVQVRVRIPTATQLHGEIANVVKALG